MAEILIIDDDADVRTTLFKLVRLSGHTVSAPSNVEEIAAAVRGGNYDLVITDLIMPELDGIEVAKLVREAKPKCPILAISGGTGNSSPDLMLHMVKVLGANATLKKPFTRAQLETAMRELLAQTSQLPLRG